MAITELATIRRQIQLQSPRAKVWKALTTREDFERWFGVKMDGSFQPGVKVKMVTTHPSYAGLEFFVVVDAMEAEHKFSWHWHPGADQPKEGDPWDPMTRVEFLLEETADGTLLTLVESGFDRISLERRSKVFSENTQGWDEQLVAFAKYVS